MKRCYLFSERNRAVHHAKCYHNHSKHHSCSQFQWLCVNIPQLITHTFKIAWGLWTGNELKNFGAQVHWDRLNSVSVWSVLKWSTFYSSHASCAAVHWCAYNSGSQYLWSATNSDWPPAAPPAPPLYWPKEASPFACNNNMTTIICVLIFKLSKTQILQHHCPLKHHEALKLNRPCWLNWPLPFSGAPPVLPGRGHPFHPKPWVPMPAGRGHKRRSEPTVSCQEICWWHRG